MPRVFSLDLLDRRWYGATATQWLIATATLGAVYFVLDADYNKYADIQHRINVELLRRFQQEKIEFAVAARTLYFKSSDGSRGAGELTQ